MVRGWTPAKWQQRFGTDALAPLIYREDER